MKRILLGLPNTGYYHFMTVSSLVSLEIPKDCQISFRFVSNCLIYDARESLAKYAIDNGFDYLLMIDSDMVLPRNTLVELMDNLDNGYDLSTGLIFKRSYPFQPCFYVKARISEIEKKFVPHLEGIIKWEKNSIIPIEACGMATCLIKVDCLKQMETPMFYPFPDIGEDITFCIKFRQKGFKLCVNTKVDVGHLSVHPITSQYQQEALDSWMANPNNKGQTIYTDGENI
jgi:hypothetical protein